MEKQKGITLIALVITIIVLLILAGVSIATLTGENGILGKATKSKEETEEATAREILAVTLLGAGQEKYTNSDYDEKEWLNSYIENQNKEHEIDIEGDVVTVNGWEFEIDRSIPAIKGTVGKSEKDTNIKIQLKQAIDVEKKILKIEIIADKDIKMIKVNEEEITANKENGKYVIQMEVEPGQYEVKATDTDNKWNTASIEITEEIPIYDKGDMELFRDLVNSGNTFAGKTVVLKNDIDLEGSKDNQWTPIGKEEITYRGTFDGNNKTIRGLYMDRGDVRYLGLFYEVPKGEIKKIKIEDCYINSTWNNSSQSAYLGGIVGGTASCIKQCSITGTLSFNYGENVTVSTPMLAIGGIAGYISSSNVESCNIEECYNGANILISVKKSANVTAQQIHVGGIGAFAVNTTIKDCYNTGNINVIIAGNPKTNVKGGIVGIVSSANNVLNVNDSYNTGTINAGGDVGAILGTKVTGTATINNCYYLDTCGGSNVNGGIPLTQNQIQTATFANILNKTETYSNTLDWTSSFKEGNELLWRYKDNRPILKWQTN